MKKSKLVLITSLIPITSMPLIVTSCNIPTQNKPNKTKLLNENQIATIKNSFQFKLSNKGKEKFENESSLKSYWTKLIKENKDNFKIEKLFNFNKEFKENFVLDFHKLNGFGSSHTYDWKLVWSKKNSNIPAIKYKVLCVDLNNLVEIDEERELELS